MRIYFFDISLVHTCLLTFDSFGEASDSDAEMAGSKSSSPDPSQEERPCSETMSGAWDSNSALHHAVNNNTVYIKRTTIDLMFQKTYYSQRERTSFMMCQRTSSNEQRITTSLWQHISRHHAERLKRIPKRSSEEDSSISGRGQLRRDSSDEESVSLPKQRRNP